MVNFVLALLLMCNLAFAKAVDIHLSESNTIIFNQPVRDAYVAKKQLELMLKNAQLPSSEPIYIVLDTPGGSVTDGMLFIDTVKSMDRPIHTITIFAASMGYQIAQELGTRYIIGSGTLMSHRGAVSGLSGQVPGELNARLGHLEAMLTKMNETAAKRVSMSLSAYQTAIINELWVFGQNAVDQKHADALANIKCDKKMTQETYSEEMFTPFGVAIVQYSKCPAISAPVSVDFEKNAKPEDRQNIKRFIELKNRRLGFNF